MNSTNNMTAFDTIQYCKDNSIPCFTLQMTADKRPGRWGHITSDNFINYLNPTVPLSLFICVPEIGA